MFLMALKAYSEWILCLPERIETMKTLTVQSELEKLTERLSHATHHDRKRVVLLMVLVHSTSLFFN